MNLLICLSYRLRLVFVLFVVPAALLAVALVQKNLPVRPADAESPTLIWDVDLKLANTLPRNFRTTDDPLKESKGQSPTHTGLADLHASGSGEFTADSLKLLLARTHGTATIFDLRQETHIFINGLPASWFATHDWANVGRSQAAIETDEVARVQSLQPGSEIAVRPGELVKKGGTDSAAPQRVIVERASTERDTARLLAPVTSALLLQIMPGRSTARSTGLSSRFVRCRKMAGRIFIAKPAVGGRRLSWCCTTCCETQLVFRWRTSCADRTYSDTIMMCFALLLQEAGRPPTLRIASLLCVLFTITLARIQMVDRSFGASGLSRRGSKRCFATGLRFSLRGGRGA
jgi:hypothetical protein